MGRVQSIVSLAEGERGEALVGGPEAGLGRDGEVRGGAEGRRRRGGRAERDVREEDEYLYDETRQRGLEETGGLFAALEEADRRHEGRWGEDEGRGGGRAQGNEDAETAVCPVCGVFEGDEIAVARHVEGHFAE